MIRFRTFSVVELTDADGVDVRSVLAQPKRLTVLAYLACAVPRGFHRRDTLFGLFWPDRDVSRARGSLNTTVYYLRRSLGAKTIVTRGDDEIGLAWDRFDCDAATFEEALEDGRLEDALALYRGDFLPGLFVPGAVEWERWQERERKRLRERAGEAARVLTERAEAADDVDQAARWARRNLRIAPTDERALRRLIRILDRAGDRAGALREHEAFARRLREDVGLETSAETMALVERIRAKRAPTPPSPASPDGAGATAVEHGPTEAAPPGTVSSGTAGPRADAPGPTGGGRQATAVRGPRTPRRRRRTHAAVLVVAVALSTLAGLWLATGGDDRPAEAAEPGAMLVVLPFTVRADSGLTYLDEGMADLLSATLSGAGGLRTADPRTVLNALDDSGVAQGDSAASVREREIHEIAGRFDAEYVVRGRVVGAGRNLRLTASLYGVGGDGEAIAGASVEGGRERLPSLVDDLAGQILAGLPTIADEAVDRVGGRTTESVPALEAYLEGQRELRAGHYAAAITAYRRAVDEDSTFALAYYGLSNAAIWVGSAELGDYARRAALRHGGDLAERHRQLLEAWRLHWEGEPARAERLYREVLTRHPDHAAAWYQLGDLLFHWGSLIGRPLGKARWPFERVVALEPRNVNALVHLARIAGTEGRAADVDTLVGRILALEPAPERTLEMEVLRTLTVDDGRRMPALRREALYAENAGLQHLVDIAAAHTADLEAAAELARDLMVPLRQERWHLFRLKVAEIEVARGRWSAAKPALDALGAEIPARAVEFRAMLAALPFLSVPRDELRAIREALPRPDGVLAIGSWGDFLTANEIYEPRAVYLLGLLSLRLDDTRAATRHAAELEGFRAGGARDVAFAADFARTLRAELARRQGEPSRALSALGEPDVPPDGLLPTVITYPEAHARWLRAELLRELGRDREALEWYASFPDPTAYDVMYIAAAHLRRAEIHERLEEPGSAARHYARALGHWSDADSALAPLVDRAREGLERTRGR